MRGVQDTLCHEGQPLCGLKGGTWRILTHYATVQQRLPHILAQRMMVLGTLATHHHTRVVAGRTDHAENLAGSWFNGHDTADFSLHQAFA